MALYRITELEFNAKAPITQFEALEYHVALARFNEWCQYRHAELDRDESDGEIEEGEELTAYYEAAHWIKLEAE